MKSILVLSEDSGLLYSDSYEKSDDRVDSLQTFQLSSSLFALYKISVNCFAGQESPLKWLLKVISIQ